MLKPFTEITTDELMEESLSADLDFDIHKHRRSPEMVDWAVTVLEGPEGPKILRRIGAELFHTLYRAVRDALEVLERRKKESASA